MSTKATYLIQRATAIAAFFRGWRGALVGASLGLGTAAFFAGGWAVFVFVAAAAPLVVLLGVLGARVASNLARLEALEAQLAAGLPASGAAATAPAPAPAAPLPVTGEAPGVTVVVTVHDDVDVIHEKLASVQAQLPADWECVVVDDLSTDGTPDVAFDGFGNDPRFRFVQSTAARGPDAARDLGLTLARGRHVTFVDGGEALHPDALAVRVAALEAAGKRSEWPAGATQTTGEPAGGYRRLAEVRHQPLPGDPAEAAAGRVLLFPSAAYHVDEVGPLAEQLVARGVPPLIMVSEQRWQATRRALRRYRFAVHQAPAPGAWLDGVAGVLAFNDWGEDPKEHVRYCNERGIPTFGKVEGAQDFADADVEWDRQAYQTVRHVLCQGDNDVVGVPTGIKHVVGSSRLEAMWLAPPRRATRELAVINLNFTYGVLEDARREWLDSAIEGCEQAAMPFVISLHPAERHRPAGVPVSTYPMAHLLTRASVLISRFSTVPFEAMARGVPFVYHNPHGEKVPAFQEPDGAFDISYGAGDLAAAIEDARKWSDHYRERCASFFLAQVDVDPERPSAERGAAAIAGVVATGAR